MNTDQSRLTPSEILIYLFHCAEKDRRKNLVHSLERLAQQVLLQVDPPSPWGSVDCLNDLLSRLDAQMTGRVVSDGPGGSRSNSNSREDAILSKARIDAAILRRLSTWRGLQKFMTDLGFGALATQEACPVPRSTTCLVCSSQYRDDIDRMLLIEFQPERQVEYWLLQRGERISDSTLRRHKHHHSDANVKHFREAS